MQSNSRRQLMAETPEDRPKAIERDQLERELIRAYKERYEEDMELNAEWEYVTLEGWPENGAMKSSTPTPGRRNHGRGA